MSNVVIAKKITLKSNRIDSEFYAIEHRIVRLKNVTGHVSFLGKTFSINDGSCIYVPSYTKVHTDIYAKNDLPIELEIIIIEKEHLANIISRIDISELNNEGTCSCNQYFLDGAKVISIIKSIFEVTNSCLTYKDVIIEGLTFSLIHSIVEFSSLSIFKTAFLSDRFVDKVEEIVSKDIRLKWKLNEVAARLNMSTATLQRKMRSENVEFSHLIQQIRLKRARIYLMSTCLNISQISEKCGFESAAYFSSVFKKTHDVSPSHYRKVFRSES
ncbi:hypothetical protein BIT28_04505 [Photobacterium proteolyticum]|uniref:HTH araC/xylS-type domain-containing protein n=1 Tax=Photobacterium proteolyticum TaxID=1903952 RepID=A0A1Q9H1U0_9GAMM|nr:helix-turn-helix transcriptional regulator [Photobacterium proteolyticum]OLQ81648.1 hypothetical protein BIT28_04505 [Photobacterium proteolyticum]